MLISALTVLLALDIFSGVAAEQQPNTGSARLSRHSKISVAKRSTKNYLNKRKTCTKKPISSANTTSVSSTAGASSNSSFVAMGWYAGWATETAPVSSIPWSKYSHISFSFGVTTKDKNIDISGSGGQTALTSFISTAKSNNVKPMITIGGWTGGVYFSTIVESAASRKTFISNVVSFLDTNALAGVDFDWEYPNSQGIGCNQIAKDDTANFGSLLKELRATVGTKYLITAATSLFPYVDASGEHSTSLPDFASSLDWINIMAYDVWGAFSTGGLGPNAPLDDSCAATDKQQGSATSGVAKWISAGFKSSQIVLGVPTYGHNAPVLVADAFPSGEKTTLAAYPKMQPLAKLDSKDVCGNQDTAPSSPDYRTLLTTSATQAKAIVDPTTGEAAPGMVYRWDNCSQTPFVYDEAGQMMYSYDNAKSFAAKGAFIKTKALRGFAAWTVTGDDDKATLLDAIRSAAI